MRVASNFSFWKTRVQNTPSRVRSEGHARVFRSRVCLALIAKIADFHEIVSIVSKIADKRSSVF